MINKIRYKSEEFSYPVFEYLHPYLMKLVWREHLAAEIGGILIIPEKYADEFKGLLKRIMLDLLEEFYEEPKEKNLLEFSGRYEKIVLNKDEYILNIATNGKDRTIFQIYSLFDWLKKVSHSCD